jgi:hypothetical protein
VHVNIRAPCQKPIEFDSLKSLILKSLTKLTQSPCYEDATNVKAYKCDPFIIFVGMSHIFVSFCALEKMTIINQATMLGEKIAFKTTL